MLYYRIQYAIYQILSPSFIQQAVENGTRTLLAQAQAAQTQAAQTQAAQAQAAQTQAAQTQAA